MPKVGNVVFYKIVFSRLSWEGMRQGYHDRHYSGYTHPTYRHVTKSIFLEGPEKLILGKRCRTISCIHHSNQ